MGRGGLVAEPPRGERGARLDPEDDVDPGVAGGQGSGVPGSSAKQRSVAASIAPASRSSAARSGPFQRPSMAHGHSAVQRATP